MRGRSHASRECTLTVNDTLQPKLLGLLAFPEEIDVNLGIIPLRKEVLEVNIQDILRNVEGEPGLLLRAMCQVNELGRLERLFQAELIPLITGRKKVLHHLPAVLWST